MPWDCLISGSSRTKWNSARSTEDTCRENRRWTSQELARNHATIHPKQNIKPHHPGETKRMLHIQKLRPKQAGWFQEEQIMRKSNHNATLHIIIEQSIELQSVNSLPQLYRL
ncbi:unnamed protein product [Heterobilharzia americana]|nr:unnamed protein product [Heterobilharzia americana]CAH8573714.1 unnamed protein product [Heterobilharzia americana]